MDWTQAIIASTVFSFCFMGIGIGILFFNRDNIGGDCRKAPEDRQEGCLSKEIGICPLDDSENYLAMATRASRLKKKL